MTDKTKELEKCEHNVYVQNCDICNQENKLQGNHSNMVLNSNRETGSPDNIEQAIKNVINLYSEDFDEDNFIIDMKKEFDFILMNERNKALKENKLIFPQKNYLIRRGYLQALEEVEKIIDEIHYQKYVSSEHNCNSEYDYPWFDDEEFKKDIFKQLQKLGEK